MADPHPTSVTVIDGEGNALADTEDPVVVAFVKVVAVLEKQTPRARRRILAFVQDYLDEERSKS